MQVYQDEPQQETAKPVTDWRTHDYGDADIERFRKLKAASDAKEARHNKAARKAHDESRQFENAIQRRVLHLLIGQQIRMIPGATRAPELAGEGTLLKVNRTRAEVKFGEWCGTVPLEWVRPAGDGEWFTWGFITLGGSR